MNSARSFVKYGWLALIALWLGWRRGRGLCRTLATIALLAVVSGTVLLGGHDVRTEAEAAKASYGPWVLNCQAPDEGNMHTLLHWGTPEQKEKYLRPLCDGTAMSCFAMTEPEVAGSDPTLIRTTAVQDGDEWVANGHKWFISNARRAKFAILICRTEDNPDLPQAATLCGACQVVCPVKIPLDMQPTTSESMWSTPASSRATSPASAIISRRDFSMAARLCASSRTTGRPLDISIVLPSWIGNFCPPCPS